MLPSGILPMAFVMACGVCLAFAQCARSAPLPALCVSDNGRFLFTSEGRPFV
jgi:hypothetical protein